jgi:uncharacterized protein YdeI (YjbR/CyaY-like superfamily)
MAERLETLPRVEVGSAAELRDWLAAHGPTSGSVWLVTSRKHVADRYLAWADLVDELLCFGWIDSLPRKLDADRTMHLIAPRKPGSAWSAVNKVKVASLLAEGRMTPGGLAAIDAAKMDGSWEALTEADPERPPEDLRTALAQRPTADAFFARFPRSSRRAILEWIALARSPETRARRIAETVERAAENRKANHPKGRDAGPKPDRNLQGPIDDVP